MAPEAESGSGEEDRANALPPEGWRRIGVFSESGPADVIEVDPTRPDFPHHWRTKEAARHAEILATHEPVANAVRQLRESIPLDHWDDVVRAILAHNDVNPGPVVAEGEHPIQVLGVLHFALRKAAEGASPPEVPLETTIGYLAERVFPADVALVFAGDQPPVRIVTNADPAVQALFVLRPGETAVTFHGIARRDLNERLGRFITEALDIQSPTYRRGKGGRQRRSANTNPGVTPELVARLFHWEEWSHRRIAAFVGWLKPTDDWDDPKVRARIEMRVRRWVRDGEPALRQAAGDPDDEAWKRRPRHLQRAIEERGRRTRVDVGLNGRTR